MSDTAVAAVGSMYVCVVMPLQAVWASDAKRLCLFLPLATVEPGCSLLAQGHPSLQNSWICILHVPLALNCLLWQAGHRMYVLQPLDCSKHYASSCSAVTHGAQGKTHPKRARRPRRPPEAPRGPLEATGRPEGL